MSSAFSLRLSTTIVLSVLMMGGFGAPSAAQQVPKGQMPALGRPTETGDKVPLFDFDYFVGKWTFEWNMPESPLGPAGPYTGTTLVSKVDERFYEAITEGEGPSGAFKIREVIAYQKDHRTVSRLVSDSRGVTYLQSGPIGGDLGGIYNIHFESAPFVANGKTVRLRNTLHLLSPLNYRVASTISVDGGPFTNLGTPWWRKTP
ncbi:MAG TPA: hypothetical protein VEC39_16175 [Vicinamibacterales bacterium]|nr:hypothetical protein [Vicinamibacterales bacterium]